MKVDLSAIEVFADEEINFDKKITFIFGKNGTGKSTITKEIERQFPDYEVLAFQGFSKVIGDNKRLNAVVLGNENAEINEKITEKREEIEKKNLEIEKINKTLAKPENDNDTNFWTKREKALEAGAEKASLEEMKIILPMITSNLRRLGMIDKVIEYGEAYIRVYKSAIYSQALFTSIGAAYADREDYVRAKEYADKAYAYSGGKGAPELSALYGRIKANESE